MPRPTVADYMKEAAEGQAAAQDFKAAHRFNPRLMPDGFVFQLGPNGLGFYWRGAAPVTVTVGDHVADRREWVARLVLVARPPSCGQSRWHSGPDGGGQVPRRQLLH